MQESIHQQQIQQISRYDAINQIINYSQKNNKLLQKYSQDFFINYFDHQMIQDLVKSIPLQLQMKKQQFVRLLAKFIKHQPDQTLFLVISLINVFKRIKQQIKSDNSIKISDFTSHICEQISNKNQDKLIPLKQIVGERIKPNPFKIRTIDLQPPIIISEIQKQIPQILKDKNKKDKKVDPQKQLKQFLISPSLGYIMTLGSLSSMINIFDLKFQKKNQLTPLCYKKIDKKLPILSFAYSQKQQRIGAILNNIGIAFWDFNDNFRTQKLIQKTLGKKIFYLELADQWVTADNDCIYYWDLKDQNIKARIKQKSKSVNDVCQITHIRSTAVAYTFLDESKWVIIYQAQQSNIYRRSGNNDLRFQFKRLARINLSPSGCHSLYYNRFTQLIIPLGYKNDIPLYNIDNRSLDVSLITQLKGHNTIVTCISQIDETDIIFTGDDHGYVIVWTMSDMRCQQVIKIANQILSLKCIGNMLFYGDARINRVFIEGLKIKVENKNNQLVLKNQTYYGIYKYYRSQKNQIYIFMQKTCRIINMLNGKTLKVIQICTDDQQILIAISNNTGFIIGTSKGDILHYSYDFYLKWRLNNAHNADCTQLKYDKINRFILSTGRDNNIFIWSQKTLQDEGPRKALISTEENNKEQIFFTQLSQKYAMFVTCSYTNQIRIWDYQSCKLAHVIQIQSNVHPVSITISQTVSLMIVACSNQIILFYRFIRKQSIFSFQIIANISRKYFIQNLSSNDNLNLNYIKKQTSTERCSIMPQLNIKMVQNCKQQKQQNLLQGNVQKIILNSQNNMFQVIIAYGKGKLTIIDIKSLYNKYFDKIDNDDSFKKSANIQRPIKQSFIKQIQKSQVKRTIFDQKILISTLLSSQSIKWDKKIHKDSITNLDIFEGKYISTLCNDGYYKLIDMFNGQQICSMNINYPLPIKWDYKPNKSQQLCQKIHQALIVIDDILTNNQDLTKKQFQALDVKQFLDIICKKNVNMNKLKPLKSKFSKKFNTEHKTTSPINDPIKNLLIRRTIQQNVNLNEYEDKNNNNSYHFNNSNKIQILSDQFTALDIKRITKPCPTLKSYQVYKRIKTFININKQNQHQHQHLIKSQLNRKKTLIQDRQSILQLLSQNYLPKLLNKEHNDYILNEFKNNKNKQKILTLTKQDFGRTMSQSTNKHFNSTKYSASPFKKIQLEKIDKFNVTINNSTINSKNNNKFDMNNSTMNSKFDINNNSTINSNISKFDMNNHKNNQNSNKLGSNKRFNTENNMKMNRNNVIKEICQKVNSYKKVLNVIKF